MPPTPTSPIPGSTSELVDRVQNFITENKRAVLIATAAAVIATGGITAYYLSTSKSSSRKEEKGKRRKDKGGNSKHILEEVKPDGPGKFKIRLLSIAFNPLVTRHSSRGGEWYHCNLERI